MKKIYRLIHFVCGITRKNHPQSHSVIQPMENLSGSYTAICHLWRTDVNWKERKRIRTVKKILICAQLSSLTFPPELRRAAEGAGAKGRGLCRTPRAHHKHPPCSKTAAAGPKRCVSWGLHSYHIACKERDISPPLDQQKTFINATVE